MTNNITTFTGKSIDPLDFNIKHEDIDIKDIAVALSRIPRFIGHSRYSFSVAQHSVMVADRLRPGAKLAGLLHDASEAYLYDIPRPVKHQLPTYYKFEFQIMELIYKRFGLPTQYENVEAINLYKEVKQADDAQLQYEIQELMTPKGQTAMLPMHATPSFRCWSPDEAEYNFLELFNSLV